MTRITLITFQVTLFLIMLLFYLSGIGCRDSRSGMFLSVGSVTAAILLASIYVGGIL